MSLTKKSNVEESWSLLGSRIHIIISSLSGMADDSKPMVYNITLTNPQNILSFIALISLWCNSEYSFTGHKADNKWEFSTDCKPAPITVRHLHSTELTEICFYDASYCYLIHNLNKRTLNGNNFFHLTINPLCQLDRRI